MDDLIEKFRELVVDERKKKGQNLDDVIQMFSGMNLGPNEMDNVGKIVVKDKCVEVYDRSWKNMIVINFAGCSVDFHRVCPHTTNPVVDAF